MKHFQNKQKKNGIKHPLLADRQIMYTAQSFLSVRFQSSAFCSSITSKFIQVYCLHRDKSLSDRLRITVCYWQPTNVHVILHLSRIKFNSALSNDRYYRLRNNSLWKVKRSQSANATHSSYQSRSTFYNDRYVPMFTHKLVNCDGYGSSAGAGSSQQLSSYCK